MIELQLVGYTADLEYLVFCDAARGASRFKAPVDEDLLATLGELVERTDPARLEALLPPAPAPPPPPPPPPAPAPPTPAAAWSGIRPGEGPLAAVALLAASTAGDQEEQTRVETRGSDRPSRLSPREIQALLRAGRTPAAVARDAGIDEEWVQRWLPPIEAERERILRAVRGATLHKARLGPSERPLGEAVDLNLRAKVRGDDSVEWAAARRDGDAFWSVSVRYRSRGRIRRARWRYDPETREVTAQDKPSLELGWSRNDEPRAPEAAAAAAPGKRSAKKTATKKASSTKTSAKKATAKKATAKKAAAKKATVKKGTAKKAPPPKAAAKATAKRTSPAKAAVKKVAAKSTTANKPAPRSTASRPSSGSGGLLPPPVPVGDDTAPPRPDPPQDVEPAPAPDEQS